MSSDDGRTEYENRQIKAIEAWKNAKPGVISKATKAITYPAAWIVQKTIPQATIRGLLDGANWTASGLTFQSDIKRRGEVENIADLRTRSLELSDMLADRVHNWVVGFAAAEGAVTGVAGLLGILNCCSKFDQSPVNAYG